MVTVNPKKIVARWLLADLNPPLGYPGGSCYFQERVRKEVGDTNKQNAIINTYQEHGKLSPREDMAVYREHSEGGVQGTPFKDVVLSAHAQQRMDLRGVTVPQLKHALRDFWDVWQKAKSQTPAGVDDVYTRKLRDRDIRWASQRLGLELYMTVLKFQEPDKKRGTKAEVEIRIDTLFWGSGGDVKPIPESECEPWDGWSKEYPEHGFNRNFPKIVAARWLARKADATPPLGNPGGPCQVMQRIHDEVENPELRDNMVDMVEMGKPIPNDQASKIYEVQIEEGPSKLIQKVRLTAHSQYRMDLRGITVDDLKKFMVAFNKAFFDGKSTQSIDYKIWSEAMAWGEAIKWTAKKMSDLTVVFEVKEGVATVVTAYFKVDDRPKAVPEESCGFPSAGRVADLKMGPEPGVQTFVTDKSEDNLPTDIDREQEVNLPLPGAATPGGGGRDITQFNFNTPSGDWDISDRPRTLGIPGDQYDSPTKYDYGMPTRRLLAQRIAKRWASRGNP